MHRINQAQTVKSMRTCIDMNDSRLIGTWRSDARRTALDVAARRDVAASKKKKLLSLFGKLELRYTPTHCYSTMGDSVTVNPYTVVAKDAWSVVVVGSNLIAGKEIVHIHFEGHHYWIYLGSSGMREFFKRVNRKRMAKTKKMR
jgi:hypothetical protein